MRYFHNLYGIFQLSNTVGITAGLDAGMEQRAKGSSRKNYWYSPVLIVKINTSSKTALALRGEYYADQNGVIIATGTPNGFRTWGWSANFDVAVATNATWRVEARTLSSKDAIFSKDNTAVSSNTFLSTAIAISF